MKIRTDFVTNSSSSSFIVSISIDLKNGNSIYWESDWYSCEDNGEIYIDVSAKQMADCSNVNALADMLQKNVYVEGGRSRVVFKSNSRFLTDIRTLESMDEIKKISVSGEESFGYDDNHNRYYSYDRVNNRYEMKLTGECQESEGTGGTLVVKDYRNAIVSADSDTGCNLSIRLTAKDGSWREYNAAPCRQTDNYRGKCSAVKIYHIGEEIGKCSSLNEMIALADKAIWVDESPVNLGKILIEDNESIKSIDDLGKLEVVLDEMVLGDQGQIKYQATYVEGKATYSYDFVTGTENTTIGGNVFCHDTGAVVEIIHEDSGALPGNENKEFSKVGEIKAYSPFTKYRFVTVKFSPRGKSYDYLCNEQDVKVGDTVIVDGYNGISELEVLAVNEKCAGELPMAIEKYKTVEKR